MRSLPAIFALALVATASCKTVSITWKDCSDSSYHGKVKDIKITPNPPVLGKPISVVAEGTIDEDVSGGQYELKIKKFITILDHKDNVCGDSTIKLPLGMGTITVKGLTCPQKAGAISLGQEMTISNSAPNGAITIALTAKDSKSGNLLCINVVATISGSESKLAQIAAPAVTCKKDADCHMGGDMGGYCKANGDCHCTAPFFSSNGKGGCDLSCCPSGKAPCTAACCRENADCTSGGDKAAYCKSPKSTLHTTPGNGMCRCGTGFSGTTSCHKAEAEAQVFPLKGVAHCTKDSQCPSSYCQNGVCHACGDQCCLTDKDCPGSYCANDPTKMPPYTCHGAVEATLAAAPVCFHEEDVTDHKCFEACAASQFHSKGIETAGVCPSKYTTIDKTVVEEQCPDGVTNLRYCQSTALNVTIKTKGESGALTAFDVDEAQVLENTKMYHAPLIEAIGESTGKAAPRPAVIVHGMGDAGTNPGMKSICATVAKKYPGTFTLCSTTADGMSSIFTKMPTQVAQFAAEVRSHPELANGFNAVGLSQGNTVLEGYIALYNDPPVHNFVSICGPLQGEGTCPDNIGFKLICPIWKLDPYGAGLAFSGYWKDVKNEATYKAKSTFLADVLNERDTKNATVANNFKSLNALVTIEATKDTMIVPKESEQFGFWAWGDNSHSKIVAMRDSEGYKGDWTGLQTMDKAGKLHNSSFVGEHIRFNAQYWDDTVLPYLGQ